MQFLTIIVQGTNVVYSLERQGVINHTETKSLSLDSLVATVKSILAEQKVDAISIATDIEGSYSSSYTIEDGKTVQLQQYLQEQVNVPVIDGEIDERNVTKQIEDALEQSKWNVTYYGFEAGKAEKSREAILTVGNGYFGLRGSMVECKSSESHYPGLYLAGGFNTLETPIGDHVVSNEDFVNFPNAQFFSFQINEKELFTPTEQNIIELKRTLNLKTGFFESKMIVQYDNEKQVEITTQKIASMANPHELAIRYSVKPLNFAGAVTIVSEVDGTIQNEGVDRYKNLTSQHLKIVEAQVTENTGMLKVVTQPSEIEMTQEMYFNYPSGTAITAEVTENEIIEHTYTKHVEEETSLTVEKIINISTNKDPIFAVKEKNRTFDEILVSSKNAWAALWEQADVQVEKDIFSQFLLRLHIYHLLVSASPHNEKLDASIGARGLHGEAYRGHIFWDELFVLPFYFQNFPHVGKQLLMYRYNRLDAARAYANEFGYKGAMFPWQSGKEGTEQSQTLHLNPVSGKWDPDHSALQRHVSLAVAYNVLTYVHMTDDLAFLKNYGAEMLLEIARFWASASTWNSKTNRYDIHKVMGPDEFHEMYPGADEGGLTNNAYTNMMVAWLFAEMPKVFSTLTEDEQDVIYKKFNVTTEELLQLNDIAHKLTLDMNNAEIIAQYQGYLDLEEIDLKAYAEKYGNIYRMDRILRAEGKSADSYQVAKQADMLMIFYTLTTSEVQTVLEQLGYELSPQYIEKNLDYYLSRTSHGSTLSRVVHTVIAELIGDRELAWELYHGSLVSDYQDIQGGSTAEGIHTGVMAGTVTVALQAFAGLQANGEYLTFAPHIPVEWGSVTFNYLFKGIHFTFKVGQDSLHVIANSETKIIVCGKIYEILPGMDIKIKFIEEK